MKRIVALSVLACLLAAPASAQWGDWKQGNTWTSPQARDAVKAGQNKSLSEIYAGLRQRYGGRPLDARLVNGDTYQIRWETGQGQVLDLTVDAHTGRVR